MLGIASSLSLSSSSTPRLDVASLGAMQSRDGSAGDVNAAASGAHGAHGARGAAGRHSNVYVKNLADDVDELELKRAFEVFGTVESCCVIRDVSTNSSRGFGFVKFELVAQAEAAIAGMHGENFHGRVLEVKFANSDSSTTTAAADVGTLSDNIYVKGLPPNWTEAELRAYFRVFGAIVESRLLHASGTTTAGALIRFASLEQAASAVITANDRIPRGGTVPLVIRFAESHGKTRRGSKSERNLQALQQQQQQNGGAHPVLIPQAQVTAAAAAAAAHHPGVVSPGTALMALAAAGEGSAHNLDIAGMLLARQNAAANALLQHAQQQQQHRAGGSFHGANGVIDEDSARGGSASGNLFGAHPAPGSSVGGSSGIMSRGNSLGGFSVGGSARGQFGALEMLQESGHQFAATTPPQQRFAPKRANPATGWVRPGYPGDEGYLGGGGGGLGHGLGSSFGETGVGGLSAMFASGLDVSGPGRATVAAPSLGTTPESTRLSNPTLDPGASPTSFTQRTGSVGSSLGSRGSSVRGGNAFGPGSSLVGAGGPGLGFSAASSSVGVAAPTRAAASPVGSFNGGGLWSNGGESRGVGRDARSSSSVGAPMPTTKFPFPFPAVDRADTPGISPEDAREMLDRLESPDGVAGAEDDDAKRIVVVRGVPNVPEAELLLYRAFAPHGALASVSVEGDREARVRFAKREEARAAARAVDGSILGGRVVVASMDHHASSNGRFPSSRPSPSA